MEKIRTFFRSPNCRSVTILLFLILLYLYIKLRDPQIWDGKKLKYNS